MPALLGTVLAGVSLVAWMRAPQASAGPCDVAMGPASLPDVSETSGLAVGRRQPVIWTHNDSGHATDLFALDEAGREVGRVRVPVETRDFEDVSAGRCAAGDCLYVADIGDNARRRPRVVLHRLPEPGAGTTHTAALETFVLTYPDGPHNAEGLFVLGEEAFLVTKDRRGTVYRTGPLPAGGGAITMQRVGDLGLEVVTDAEASTDGRTVIVRTPDVATLHRAADVVAGRLAPYLTIPLLGLREPQGEGVAMRGDAIYLSSEGRIGGDGRLLRLRCRLPAP
ncbi:hypothetical protein [Luteitalea sp. TBR-22]|uniref:hypothetical protein n=1 Tax=Luteitalea sp. TBR-22 TaxID=2802971 RepID=UPI001EF51866|nr:hypothetical protein [Luteitalea sp. TBR-22]